MAHCLCPDCRQQISANDRTCVYCGADVRRKPGAAIRVVALGLSAGALSVAGFAVLGAANETRTREMAAPAMPVWSARASEQTTITLASAPVRASANALPTSR